jgi:hypothetical protein
LVAVSLLLTIPVDCLVATTTWRRLRSKYSRARFERDAETGESSFVFSKARARSSEHSSLLVDAVDPVHHDDEQEEKEMVRSNHGLSHDGLDDDQNQLQQQQEQEQTQEQHVSAVVVQWPSRSAVREHHTVSVPTGQREEQEGEEDCVPRYDCHFNNYTRESAESVHSGAPPRRTLTPQATQHPPQPPRLLSVEDPLLLDGVEHDNEGNDVHALLPSRQHALPVLLLWMCCVGVSLAIQHWLYLVATVGTVSVVALMFLFPAALYFRLGLLSDFQARPLLGSMVPNRVYMTAIAVVGVCLLLFDASAVVCFSLSNAKLAQRD